MRKTPHVLLDGNQVRLLRDGSEAFPAMLNAIEQAQEEINLEMYWFASDRTGLEFSEALSRAARRGVQVYLVYDAIGSLEANPLMFAAMRRAGVKVCEYNPIAPWRSHFRIARVNHRNHRKVLVVDNRLAFTGGINLGDAWASREAGGQNWRDDMIAVEGPAAAQFRELFFQTWKRFEGSDPDALNRPPPRTPPPRGDAIIRVLANHYLRDRRVIQRAYLRAVFQARRRVYITNSYFLPDRRVLRALLGAATRGVDVRIIVPALCDVLSVKLASQGTYETLLEAGVRIFEMQERGLHSKTAVVDSHWITIGSYNLDHRSWRFNLEINAEIRDAHLAKEMEAQFHRDLGFSKEIHLEEWQKRSTGRRMGERFFYLFRKLL